MASALSIAYIVHRHHPCIESHSKKFLRDKVFVVFADFIWPVKVLLCKNLYLYVSFCMWHSLQGCPDSFDGPGRKQTSIMSAHAIQICYQYPQLQDEAWTVLNRGPCVKLTQELLVSFTI